MNVDDFVKLLLVIAFTFSLVGISIQLMRLIGTLNSTTDDSRKIVKNLGLLTDKMLEDYEFTGNQIKPFVTSLGNINTNIIEPVVNLLSFLRRFNKKKKK